MFAPFLKKITPRAQAAGPRWAVLANWFPAFDVFYGVVSEDYGQEDHGPYPNVVMKLYVGGEKGGMESKENH